MNDLYIVLHLNDDGVSTFLVKSDHEPSEDEAVLECDIDFDPVVGEWIEIHRLDKMVIYHIPPKA